MYPIGKNQLCIYSTGRNFFLYHARQSRHLPISLFHDVSNTEPLADIEDVHQFIIDLVRGHCEHCGYRRGGDNAAFVICIHLDEDDLNTDYRNLISVCPKCAYYIKTLEYADRQLWHPGIFLPPWAKKRGLVATS